MEVLITLPVYWISVLSLRKWINFCHNKGITDAPTARKQHLIETPTSGGIIFIIPALLITLLCSFSFDSLIVSMAMVSMGVVGFIDDRFDLSAMLKFVFQFTIAMMLIYAFGSFQFFEEISFIPKDLHNGLSIVLAVGLFNALNLMDGSDGLVGLYSIVFFGVSLLISIISEAYLPAVIVLAILPSILAFLKFNWSPAKVFMGDTGSLVLGTLIVSITLFFDNLVPNSSNFHFILYPLLMIPIWDTMRVMIWRVARRKNPFKADRTHYHHILKLLKLTPDKIAVIVASVSMLLIALGYVFLVYNFSFVSLIICSSIITLGVFELSLFLRLIQLKRKSSKTQLKFNKLLFQNQLLKSKSQ